MIKTHETIDDLFYNMKHHTRREKEQLYNVLDRKILYFVHTDS